MIIRANATPEFFVKIKVEKNYKYVIIILLGLVVRPRSITGGEVPRYFYYREFPLRELSIFIDESGDFGDYDYKSPYYIIAMVFHNQNIDISSAIKNLDMELSYMNLSDICIHTGPIIRREEVYSGMNIVERRRILNKLVSFYKQIDISYKCFFYREKTYCGCC